ncbi:uncharacterized protein LOC135809557 [Sycon ciliatum]|uniref:uncharacterized protein LOC135809557 n=1 Tax=Sycon ciliatum TaxID=27933 RepID=UPI0020A8D98E|eukprot:scpid20399/ scgid14672/ Ankyrin-1; Erythrocyte ankyrin
MTELITAVKAKDKAKVETLLEGGSDPNENGAGGKDQSEVSDVTELNGPLHWACRYNLPDIVELLVDHGASLFLEGENGQTPLHLAHSSSAVTSLLLDKSASIYAEDTLQRTPLYVAAQSGDTDVVKVLLEAGSDACQVSQGCGGRTALHEVSNSVDKCKLLLENGASAEAVDSNGKTALHCARHVDVVRLLLDNGCAINTTDKSGNEALHDILNSTATSDKGAIIKLLLERGASANANNADGESPVFLAVSACNGFTAPLSELLAHSANPNSKTKDGLSPLLCAMKKGYIPIVQHLIKAGASLNEKDNSGNTTCHYAARGGNVNLMLQIFKNQAPETINDQNADGDTPLHVAVGNGNVNMVAYLLSVGAEVNVVNKANQSPIEQAEALNKENIARMLVKHLDKVKKPPPPPVVVATEDCQSGMPGHLPFVEGDLIAITGKPYDEWWEGYVVSDPETKGLFCTLLVDQQPLDEDEARAAIEASGRPKEIISQSDYKQAVDMVSMSSVGTKVTGQAAGLLCEQEDVLRSECPLLTDDERALFASLKVLLSETSGSSLEQAPLLRAINKAIDRIDSQLTSKPVEDDLSSAMSEAEQAAADALAAFADSSPAGDDEGSAAAASDSADSSGKVKIVEPSISAEEMEVLKTSSDAQKEQLADFKEMVTSSAQQFAFAVRLMQKLSEVLLAFKCLACGLEKREVDDIDKACSSVELLGTRMALPAACLDEPIKGRATKAQLAKKEKLHDQIRRIANLCPSVTAVDDICLGLAQALVNRYDLQITQLMYEGAVQLAEGVVMQLLEYILVDCPDEQNLDTIVPSLVHAIVFARRSAHTSQLLKKEGIPCQPSKIVGKAHTTWSIDGVLRKTGILTPEGRKYVGLQTRADLFGYRHGTKSEVDSLNMVRQGYEKTIGPKQRRASKVGVPMPPAAPVLDSDPTAKAVTPTQKEVRPIEKGSYWLRKQEELSERIKQLELLTNASK